MSAPVYNTDLHGNAPDEAEYALLIIDMISDFSFENGEALFTHALPAAKAILALKERAKAAGVPVIYVNDNFGKWQSDFTKLVSHCLKDSSRGKPIVELLHPEEDDYFVLKPKHSAFFSTTLDVLLRYLKTKALLLTGVTGNMCIFFTASDAYMRYFGLIVPPDCVASCEPAENRYALNEMRNLLKANVRPSDEILFHKSYS